MTYAESQKRQKQFIRFLVAKLHLVNAMSDQINNEFIFCEDGNIRGSGLSAYDLYIGGFDGSLQRHIDFIKGEQKLEKGSSHD